MKPKPTESSGHLRSLNFDANHGSADVYMNTKSSKSSTLRKSAQRDFDSTLGHIRQNSHQGVTSSGFEQQDNTYTRGGLKYTKEAPESAEKI